MGRRDVPPHEMRRRRVIRDDALEEILLGETPEGRDDLAPLAGFVAAVRTAYHDGPAPQRSSELAAFMEAPLITDEGDLSPTWREKARRRKARMLSGLSGFLATLTGKVVLGTAVAAASVGALHAGDVVDVPGLPDSGQAVVEQQDEVDSQNGEGDLPDEAVEGQQTAEEKQAAATDYTAAVREWTGCVSENAAAQGDDETRTTGSFDPREGCGDRPEPGDFGLTAVPPQAADEGQEHGEDGPPEGTPGGENVPDDPASLGDDPPSDAGDQRP